MDEQTAAEQLRSHRLEDLFTQTLEWDPVVAAHVDLLKHIQPFQQRCIPIAQSDRTIVWQVSLSPEVRLTSQLRQEIYGAIASIQPSDSQENSQANASENLTPSPLVIFVDAKQSKSLWCESPQQSALFVTGQPLAPWIFRLRQLAKAPQLESDEPFQQLLADIVQNTSGIDLIADRKNYAVVTLRRLIFIQQLQKRGWLNNDPWFLQSQFEAMLQAEEQRFFEGCLRPLYKSLSLPAVERPLALQTTIGSVPFIGRMFEAHPLEAKWPDLTIADRAFENVLAWLIEQASTDTLNPWMESALGQWFDRYWQRAQGTGLELAVSTRLAREMCDRTLDKFSLSRLSLSSQPQTLNDALFNADAQLCRQLIQEVLPSLRILDPDCNSGNLLVAFYQRLADIYSILFGLIEQNQDAQLKDWYSDLTARSPANNQDSSKFLQIIQAQILQNNLYGLAYCEEVAETARFQLLLHLVAIAQQKEDLEPLMDLEFSILSGNALVGFITVDEARFDQVNKASPGTLLQGDLLQPLAADSYKTILSEKNIALEHYQARSQLLAETHSVPPYATAALLREEIAALDAKAQRKLDALLLSHMSQQLGIRYRESSLTAKPSRRLLTLEDIQQLTPFHWGYYFNAIVQCGGFDIIVSRPSCGPVKPTVGEFTQHFQDLFEKTALTAKSFKTSKAALAKGDPEMAERWLDYQDRYALLADFFHRSELYAHQVEKEAGKRSRSLLAWEGLAIEHSLNLLTAEGVLCIAVPNTFMQDNKTQAIKNFLFETTLFETTLFETTETSILNSDELSEQEDVIVLLKPFGTTDK
ncbi:MAG: hypothetical protein AAFR12_06870 [Cyanobacteria bacterium J06626_6]